MLFGDACIAARIVQETARAPWPMHESLHGSGVVAPERNQIAAKQLAEPLDFGTEAIAQPAPDTLVQRPALGGAAVEPVNIAREPAQHLERKNARQPALLEVRVPTELSHLGFERALQQRGRAPARFLVRVEGVRRGQHATLHAEKVAAASARGVSEREPSEG